MIRKLLVATSLLLASSALAQNVQQSGTVTRNHIPVWVTSGVVADGGSAADSPISSIGVTNNGGAGICVSSDRQTAAGRNQLCFGASTTGAATISLQNFGNASAQSLNFIINGAVQGFPAVTPLPVVIGNLVCFSGTGGGLTDCGISPATNFLTPGTTGVAGATPRGVLFNNAGKLASGAPAAFSPLNYGAKCDSVTDDTTSLQTMFAAIAAAGGNATVSFPPGATCLIYNSGQAVNNNPLASWNVTNNVRVQGNGATLSVGHTFLTSESLVIFAANAASNIWVDGLNLSQVVPINIGSASVYGAFLFECANGCNNMSLTNSVVTGAAAPFFVATTTGIYVDNVQSINSIYGVVLSNGAGNATPGNSKAAFIRGLSCVNEDRCLFLRGVSDVDASVVTQNYRANDVLITCDQTGGVNENIRLNYKMLARTAGTGSTSFYVGNSSSFNTSTGCIYRNMRFNLDVDLSGDAALYPTFVLAKSTAASLGNLYEDIKVEGRIVGAPNAAGNVIDLFLATDAPWSGETAQNIIIGPLYESGSVTPAFHFDLAPFTTSVAGALTFDAIRFAGPFAVDNASNQSTQLSAMNTSFSNGPVAILNTSFGGTGLYQPAAHSILQTEGSAALGAIAAATAGKIIIDQGAGVDWASKAISGDATLAPTGALTLTGAVKTVKKQIFAASGTYTPTTGMLYAILECVGSGGSGAGGTGPATGFYVGGGGGSGGYSRTYASAATIGGSQVITVGAAGAAPAAGNTNGGAGGDVSIGSLCIGKGGSGGAFAAAAQVGTGGGGGVAGTGDFTIAGNPGQAGMFANIANVIFTSGAGASSYFGGGAAATTQGGGGTVTTGTAAGNYGGGGSGGNANADAATFAGGNGSKGVVVITEFCNQ